jgi:branched-chain amino acid aminotransferase
MIGTNAHLGIRTPRQAVLFIVLTFMGRPYTIPGGLRLRTSPENMVRAWQSGFGHAKIGLNYGPSILGLQEALNDGCHQVLWLYGERGECTEAGICNFFVLWRRKDGQKELITAPLDDKIILDGVTRRSCIDSATERLGNEMIISERTYTIEELMDAATEGRILESFCAGTAVCTCSIETTSPEANSFSTSYVPSLIFTTAVRTSQSQ